MKVLMVETGGWGGIAHYAHCLCEALAQAGVDVRLATHARKYALASFPKDYHVHRTFQGDGFLADWRRLEALVQAHAPAVVHFQSLISTRRDWIMFRWLRRKQPQTKWILTVHNVLPHEVAFGERFAYRRLYRAADGLIVHSRASRQALQAFAGNPAAPVAVIPHGHYGMLVDAGRNRSESLKALGLPEASYLTLFGAIRPYKGADWLLRAVASIRDWPEDLRVLVIGRPWGETMARELRSLADTLGIGERVVFRFEYVPEERIPDVFAASELMLLPYRHIDQSGILMAALAAGKPVVCTPVGGFPEIVNDEIGFLADNVSWQSFAEALQEALRRRDAWKSMGARAREIAERDFGWASIARRTLAFYRSVSGAS